MVGAKHNKHFCATVNNVLTPDPSQILYPLTLTTPMSSFEKIVENAYQSFKDLEQDVQEAASIDGFVVTKCNTSYPSEKVLLKGSFRCHKSGQSKCKHIGQDTSKTHCDFQLNFRLRQDDGTYHFTTKRNLVHNHTMHPPSTVMTAMARRFVPSQFGLIEQLHASGVPIAQIVSELKKTTTAVIQKRDIYNAIQRSRRLETEGHSQVEQLIVAMDGSLDFIYDINVCSGNSLRWLTFACRRSLDQFAKLSFVLLMDATYKTNRFNMPLLIISSVDQFGHSYIVACSLLLSETTESYGYALESFKRLFEHVVFEVSTIITDQETAFINAINSSFPGATHQLCQWHLMMNVKKNFPKNTQILTKFSYFVHSKYEYLADYEYNRMIEGCTTEEARYLGRLYDLRKSMSRCGYSIIEILN